jgi:hypothetical protein
MKIIISDYKLKDLQKRGDFRLKCNEILNIGDYVEIEGKVWTVKNAFQGKKEYIIFTDKGTKDCIRVSRSNYELKRNEEEKIRVFRLKLQKCRTENPALYDRYWKAKEYEKQLEIKRSGRRLGSLTQKSRLILPLMMMAMMNPFEHQSKH